MWSFSSQQATLRRLNRAFEGFFRRVKAGARPGYPRFKGRARFDSVEWPKDGDGARWHPDTRRVYLQGVGRVKVSAHRDVVGRVKTIQVRRGGRRWMLILSGDEVPRTPLPDTGRQAGVDVGIASFATTSDGDHVHNPRWARTAAAGLAAAQQRLARANRGSNNRGRRRETVAARHRKVANCRRDFHHKTARRLVETYDLIAVEDLAIATVVRRPRPVPDPDNPGQFLPNGAAAKTGLNLSITDAAWGQFLSILRAKAEDAGRVCGRGRSPAHLRRLRSLRARSHEAIVSPKRYSLVAAVGTVPTPTNTPHATSCGPDWPVTQPTLREKKLAASAVREVTSVVSCYLMSAVVVAR